jgi:hypothetical protein
VFVETLLNSNTGTVFQMNILITLSKGQSKCQFLTIAANLYLMGNKVVRWPNIGRLKKDTVKQ